MRCGSSRAKYVHGLALSTWVNTFLTRFAHNDYQLTPLFHSCSLTNHLTIFNKVSILVSQYNFSLAQFTRSVPPHQVRICSIHFFRSGHIAVVYDLAARGRRVGFRVYVSISRSLGLGSNPDASGKPVESHYRPVWVLASMLAH